MSTLIPDIKVKCWEHSLKFLEGDTSYGEFLSSKDGHSIFDLIHTNEKINKYQWYYFSGTYPRDLLYQYIIPNFLFDIKSYTNSINLKEDFSESEELKKYFDVRFDEIEKKVLLSDNFNYLILIPAYRVIFPNGISEIDLDSHHRIKRIEYQQSPYGLWNYRELPKSWDRESERAANASFEAKFSIKKRLTTEYPYKEDENPMEPFCILKNSAFDEKIRSIYEFFLCYGPSTALGSLMFGDKCFIKLPPFFQYSPFLEKSLGSKFSPPYTFLEFNLSETSPHYHNWKKIWKENYINYFDTFYKDSMAQEQNDLFKYTLKVLRTFMNIPYDDIQCFLLISTFEGILYHKDVYKKLNDQKTKYSLSKDISKYNKRKPCIKAFLEICEDQKEYRQGIFQHEFPLKTPLKKFETKDDLDYFLNLSFTYRNNIAHPEKITDIIIEEKYLYEPRPEEEISILIHFIKFELPFFLKFLLRTWLNNGYTTKAEWYDYILNLM